MSFLFALIFIGMALIGLWGLLNFKSVLKKYKEMEYIKFTSQNRKVHSEWWVKLVIITGLIFFIVWGLIGGLTIIYSEIL